MSNLFAAAVVLLVSYFLGCINGSVMTSHFVIHDDVRQHGSGNAGLTNFYRTYGAKYALMVIAFDMGKTVVACLIGGYMFHSLLGDWTLGLLIAGIGCELGHMFPVFFGFRGGKGILSSAALAIMMDWRIFVIGFSLFLIIVFATHYVSLGSILAATAYAVLFVIFFPGQPWIWSIAIAMAVLAIFMHRSNIARLLHGTETKTYLLKSKKK